MGFPYVSSLEALAESKRTIIRQPKPAECLNQGTMGRIQLLVSTVNRTYELSGINHKAPFRKYGKHSTGPSIYGPWVRTYNKLFSCKSVLLVCSYRAQSNEICYKGVTWASSESS